MTSKVPACSIKDISSELCDIISAFEKELESVGVINRRSDKILDDVESDTLLNIFSAGESIAILVIVSIFSYLLGVFKHLFE